MILGFPKMILMKAESNSLPLPRILGSQAKGEDLLGLGLESIEKKD